MIGQINFVNLHRFGVCDVVRSGTQSKTRRIQYVEIFVCDSRGDCEQAVVCCQPAGFRVNEYEHAA
jgi:hypothetical protein